MGLVKKYDNGGSFADYVKERLAKGDLPLTNKSYPIINQRLQSFDGSTVSGNVKKNWAGQIVANTPEEADAFLANLYQDYKKTTSNVSPITPKEGWGPVERPIGDLATYVANKDFGGNTEYAAQEIAKMKDNNQVKRYVAKHAKDLLSDYINKAAQNPSDNWRDLDKVKNIYSNIANIDYNNLTDDDWDKLKAWTNQLDWQIGRFLIPDAELARREEEIKVKEEAEKVKKVSNTLKGIGITDENVQNYLYQSGYTKPADNLNPYLSNYLKSKNYTALTNGQGYKIIGNNNLVTNESGLLTTDVLSPDYGKTFSIVNGDLIIHEKGVRPENFKLPEFPDEGDVSKQLIFKQDIPEFSSQEGWIAYGDSGSSLKGETARDEFGRRDFLKNIIFINKDKKQLIRAIRQDDGTYKTPTGVIKIPEIERFGSTIRFEPRSEDVLWNNPTLPLKNIPLHVLPKYNKPGYLEKVLKDLSEIEQALDNSINKENDADINQEKLKEIAQALKYYGVYGNPEQKRIADQNSSRLSKIAAITNPEGKKLFSLYKKGGILKAQNGDTLENIVKTNRQYAINAQPTTNKDATQPLVIKGVKDTSRAIKNADPLDIISLVGSGVSFIPGLGVIGGLVSTGADAIKGYKEGWDRQDTMNLFGNLGFTLLAGLGFGAAKAGKVAKQAKTVYKGAKSLDQAEDLVKMAKNLGGADEVVKSAENLTKVGKNLGEDVKLSKFINSNKAFKDTKKVEKLNDALKSAGYSEARNSEELWQVLGKDLDNVADLAKLKQSTIVNETRDAIEGVKKAGNFVIDKSSGVAKTILPLYTGYAGITGAGNLVSNVREDGLAGIGNTSVDDIRSMIQLGGLSRIGYKNRQYSTSRNLNTHVEGGTTSETTIKVDGKSFKVEGDVRQKGLNKGINVLGKKTVFAGKSQEAKKEFLEKIKKNLSDKDKEALEKILNKESIGKIEFEFSPSTGGTVVLNDAPASLKYKDVKSYNIAKKQLEGGYSQYGTLRRKVPKKDIGGLLSILGDNKKQYKLSYDNPLSNKSWYKGLNSGSNTNTFENIYSRINLPKTLSDTRNSTSNNTFEQFTPVPYTKKPYKDLGLFFNTLQYGLTNLYNDKSTNLQVRAATEIPKLNTMDYTYLKTSTPYSNYASKQAAEMRGYGNRLGTSIADIDKANAYRLQANKQASDTELQGKYRDIDMNTKITSQQADLNSRVNTYNTDIMNKISALGSQARSNVYKLYANNATVKNANIQNLLRYLTYSSAERPYKEALWNYTQETLNPNIMNAYNYEQKLNGEILDKFKKEYDEYYGKLEKTSPGFIKPEFEDSPMGRRYKEVKDAHQNLINSLNTNLLTLQRVVAAVSPYGMAITPYYARGGTLNLGERIVLENVKTYNRKVLKHEEMFYRQLLNNNKLVQAALIKVFK